MEHEQRVCPGTTFTTNATEIGLGGKTILFSHGAGLSSDPGPIRADQTRRP